MDASVISIIIIIITIIEPHLLSFEVEMTNCSYVLYLGAFVISWHFSHVIHLPLCTSMIKGEIKLFIILFFFPFLSLVAAHFKLHTGILMVVSGNDDQHKPLNLTAE